MMRRGGARASTPIDDGNAMASINSSLPARTVDGGTVVVTSAGPVVLDDPAGPSLAARLGAEAFGTFGLVLVILGASLYLPLSNAGTLGVALFAGQYQAGKERDAKGPGVAQRQVETGAQDHQDEAERSERLSAQPCDQGGACGDVKDNRLGGGHHDGAVVDRSCREAGVDACHDIPVVDRSGGAHAPPCRIMPPVAVRGSDGRPAAVRSLDDE